ncbi:MAG: hypothetical protein K0S07_72 [Chlamydiales bacterium]|jgi:hypothetical protein|nr:hypothetical protein [Chlamydiales bacterium]
MLIETFIEKLPSISYQNSGPASFAASGLLSEGSGSAFSSFLNGFNQNRQWSSWTDFIDKWRAFTGYGAAHPGLNARSGPAFTALVSDLKNALAIQAGGGDFAPYLASFTDPTDFDRDIEQIADGLMTHILNDFPFPSDGSAPTSAYFFSYLQDALTTTAYLLNSSASNNVATYEAIYSSLFSTGFSEKLVDFIGRQVEGEGFFTPSVFYDKWIAEIISDYKSLQMQDLSPNELKRRQVTDVLFLVLIQMLEIIQESISVQAKVATYIAKWQEQYTNCMEATPLYVQSPDSYAGLTLDRLHEIAVEAVEKEGVPQSAFAVPLRDPPSPFITTVNYALPKDHVSGILNLTVGVDYLKTHSFPLGGVGELYGNDIIVRQRWQGSGDNASTRSEKNQVMSQYLSNIRGRRTALSSQQKQVESGLETTNNSLNQLSAIMTAVLAQLNGMLKDIFR